VRFESACHLAQTSCDGSAEQDQRSNRVILDAALDPTKSREVALSVRIADGNSSDLLLARFLHAALLLKQ
jgi:hypothetical protein